MVLTEFMHKNIWIFLAPFFVYMPKISAREQKSITKLQKSEMTFLKLVTFLWKNIQASLLSI